MIWGVVLMVFALQDRGLYVRFPHLLMVFDQLLLLFFPLLYLYVKYLLTHHSRFRLHDLYHFLPFILSIAAHIGFFVKSGEEKRDILDDPTLYYQVLHVVLNEIIALQGVVYSILSLLMIRKYQVMIKEYESTIEKSIIKVLYAGILLNLLSWTIGIVGLHLGYMGVDIGFDYFAYTYLVLVLVIYIISYAAVKSPDIFKLESLSDRDPLKNAAGQNARPREYNTSSTDRTHGIAEADASLEDPLLIELNEKLLHYMEGEKPYLDPELSLPQLADALGVPRNQLSGVINRFQKINFYEFVNTYRVDEVKRLMQDERNKHLKLISLAYDAGFNSKASFYRIFKQMTGMTPTVYLDSLGR
jgi:AraC-like DNA-binding protein